MAASVKNAYITKHDQFILQMNTLPEYILLESPYLLLFVLTIVYFSMLYFGVSSLFISVCKSLHARKMLNKIIDAQPGQAQITSEIRHSVRSIIVFGLTAMLMAFLIRNGFIILLPDTVLNTLTGVVILNLWNEVYFFIIHRVMHTRFLMKHVHYIHHQSKIPTVYSVYSFHWFEAFLLGSVQVTVALVMPLSPMAIMIYPFTSILLNLAGHCNYRFGNGTGESWKVFATQHNQHHHKGRKNYGFALNFLDKLYNIKP
jgi:sterol desaturase/sphingolipid hydroxylase (fatty acid hydroxylase superfamily)